MRNIYLIAFIGTVLGFVSCDHIDDPYPPAISQGSYELYPDGDSAHYWSNAAPTFSANTNTLRNILIEDFTGHQCVYCPPAADTAHSLHSDYGDRVLVATIHAGPDGLGNFQATSPSLPIDWTNTEGIAIGEHFGNLSSGFIGNPRGTISRIESSGDLTLGMNSWRSAVTANLPTTLQVNIQSAANYYPSTRGLFLHTEIEVLGGVNPDDLRVVVYLIEDSIVGPQKMPPPLPTEPDYVHADVMRECIGSTWQGLPLTADDLENGKYYLNYIYELPMQSNATQPTNYEADNMHLLIYVRDINTEEIYHVVKQSLQ